MRHSTSPLLYIDMSSITQPSVLPSDHLLHVLLLSTVASISSQARTSLLQIRSFLVSQLDLPTNFAEALLDPRLDIGDLYVTFARLAQSICEQSLRVKTGQKDSLQPWYRKAELLEALEGSSLWDLIERVASYEGSFVPLEYITQKTISSSTVSIVDKTTGDIRRMLGRFDRVTLGKAEVPTVLVDSAEGLLSVRKENAVVVLKQGVTERPDARVKLVPGQPYVLRPYQFFSLADAETLHILHVSSSVLELEYCNSSDVSSFMVFNSTPNPKVCFTSLNSTLKSCFILGRSPTSDICFSHSSISKLHARICREENDWVIIAEETVNGSYRYLCTGEGRESEELLIRSKAEIVVGQNSAMRIDVGPDRITAIPPLY